MTKVYRKTYKSYAGPLIVGVRPVNVSQRAEDGDHMARAFYVTACLEASKWGSIQSYDGAAMSGGPMHWVAVLPKTMRQGPLFKLLRRLELADGSKGQPHDCLDELWNELANVGWFVSRDGSLRDFETGKAISGKKIRDQFTPMGGKVGARGSESWRRAEKWARLFYNLLSAEWTFDAQMDHSIEYLIRGAAPEELRCYQYWQPRIMSPEVVTVNTEDDLVGPTDIPMAVDFAMAAYHSFTPNAPGMAKVVLGKRVLPAYEKWMLGQAGKAGKKFNLDVPAAWGAKYDPEGRVFAKLLIKKMGTTKYGNWKDRPGASGARYDRCRKYCMRSELWPSEYYEGKDALMPRDLKG